MSNFISAGLIIVSIAVFFGYINPTYGAATGETSLAEKSIKELEEEKARYTEALNKTIEIEDARKGLIVKYNAIPSEDREALEKLLPDHIDSVRLILDINNVASEYGMALRNISLADEGPKGTTLGPGSEHVQTVGLTFTVEGPYEKFRGFLRDMEKSLRLVDVTSIGFAAAEDAYSYGVTLSTYKLNYKY